MRVFETQALLLPREGVHVQWGMEPENTDLTTVEVELQRSESPAGPFVALHVFDPTTTFAWTDRTVPWRSKNMEIYYRLVGREKTTGDVVYTSCAFGFQGRLPMDALEIIRQHNILLRGVNGHKPKTGIHCTLYKRRNFGARCPYCTDAMTLRVVISQCRMCAGTGFAEKGYYTPIAIDISFQIHPRVLQLSNLGKSEENETTAFMTNFPILYPGDMIVEPNEKHWRVRNTEVTERNRTVVHQLLRLRQLDHNDVEYEVLRHLDHSQGASP